VNPSFWRHRRKPYRFVSAGPPGNGFHQWHDQRALSIAKSTACERFLYRGAQSKLRWNASAITGTPIAYLDPSTPAIPLGYPGHAPVTGMQLMGMLTDTNICSTDRTERVVDLGRPVLDGPVLLR
jgi:hypothetical protein